MPRIKKVHKSLLLYCLGLYSFCLVAKLHLLPNPELAAINLSFASRSFHDLSDEVTVLSAYYDLRPTIDPVGPPWVPHRTPRVRVLAIVKYKKEALVKKSARDMKPKTFAAGTFPITCRLVWKEEEEAEVLEELAESEAVVLEEGGEQYVATFISCFPTTKEKGAPTEVVLATPEREVRLPVEKTLESYPATKPARSHKAAVCVRPIFGPYDNLNQIAQFVAFYSTVLGVSTFRFYLLEVSNRVANFLGDIQQSANETGITLDVVEWGLEENLKDWTVLWDYGALLALTDCVYKSMKDHGLAYIVDLDEFIVPQVPLDAYTTPAFVTKLREFKRAPRNKSTDSFLFKNTFFCSEFNEECDYEQNFDVFSAKQREDFYWSFQLRAKMLVMTDEVVAVGHHRIHDWVNPLKSFNTPIPQQVAKMHHYRSCDGVNTGFEGRGSPVLKNGVIEDESILRFQRQVEGSPVMKMLKKYETLQP